MPEIEEVFNDISFIIQEAKVQHMEGLQQFIAETMQDIMDELTDKIRQYMEGLLYK